jgi:hypothetical protein
MRAGSSAPCDINNYRILLIPTSPLATLRNFLLWSGQCIAGRGFTQPWSALGARFSATSIDAGMPLADIRTVKKSTGASVPSRDLFTSTAPSRYIVRQHGLPDFRIGN